MILSFSFIVIVILYIGLASIPFNPLSLKISKNNAIFILVPQGWGFFTRNPREAQTFIYKRINDKWHLVNRPGSDPSYYFGASRINRKILFEKEVVLQKIQDSTMWIMSTERDLNKIKYKFNPITIKNPISSPLLDGKYLIIKKFPVPWAWSESYYDINMPSKCIFVNIVR